MPRHFPQPRYEGSYQLYSSDNWSHMLTLHYLDFRMAPEVLSAEKSVPKIIWPTNPPSITRRRMEGSSLQKIVSQDIKRKLPMSLLSTSLLLSGGFMQSLQHSCKKQRFRKKEDVSASIGRGLADKETSVWKPGGLTAVFGQRVGKGEMCSVLSWQLHFSPLLLHVGGCD